MGSGNVHHHSGQHSHNAKGRAHEGGSTVAHAESAMAAGKPYEAPNEGHNQMFDNFEDHQKHRHQEYGTHANKPSRGAEVDQELAEEEQEIVDKKNERQSERVPGTKK
ncbi:hypothetical protein BCR43DRAFT_482682 [Syncephalastrum racemosum]|uniref:Uncharacterized protein n=1 Tax=Syncephalastrum racemosum TaxID=13706 RepID=A0A1X2HVE7_SYNRA|nr:hypothetical protein BCR43DRAFT_482682 [Syncephalastrum racemosum]